MVEGCTITGGREGIVTHSCMAMLDRQPRSRHAAARDLGDRDVDGRWSSATTSRRARHRHLLRRPLDVRDRAQRRLAHAPDRTTSDPTRAAAIRSWRGGTRRRRCTRTCSSATPRGVGSFSSSDVRWSAVTNPWSWYSDRDVWAVEQERIFARTWQYVGHAGMVARAGDFFTARAGPDPDRRHARRGRRAARVRQRLPAPRLDRSPRARATGRRCSARTTRGRTGSTAGCARRRARTSTLDGVGLARQVRLERWGPFLFVNADADARRSQRRSARFRRRSPSCGLDVDALRFHHRSEWTIEANWKVVAENFLECYHCAVAHPELHRARRRVAGRVPARGRAAALDADRPGARRRDAQPVPLRLAEHRDQRLPGEPNLSIGPIVPASPERTDRFLDYFFGAGRRASRGSRSCSSSTTRSAARTRRSSSACRPASRRARSRRAACSARPRSSSPTSRGSCASRRALAAPERARAGRSGCRLFAERARAGGDVLGA